MEFDRIGIHPSAVLEAASESILVTEADWDTGPTIVYVNPAFERMTGWAAFEVVGKSPRFLQGEKTDLSRLRGMKEILTRGGRWEGQAINYRKDGTHFVMEWSITPLKNGAVKLPIWSQSNVTLALVLKLNAGFSQARDAAIESDRKKANLARYFSPGIAETLSQRDHPLGPVRRQEIAVLFVDIIGFVSMSERLAPERVVVLLRSFYQRMSKVIFVHGGSIERFSGDALMALFGVPGPTGKEATGALQCAIGLAEELTNWNEKRIGAGRDPVNAGISANFGLAVLGDVGTHQSMSFTAIGDAVNIASRMQELCRSLKSRVVVSQALVGRACEESSEGLPLLARLSDRGHHVLRGRSVPIHIWTSS